IGSQNMGRAVAIAQRAGKFRSELATGPNNENAALFHEMSGFEGTLSPANKKVIPLPPQRSALFSVVHYSGGCARKIFFIMRPDTSSDGPDFDAYLAAKRIDSDLFRRSEPVLWSSWKSDFD